MANNPEDPKLLATDQPDLFFEDNTVGRCKKEVWDSSDEEIDALLAEIENDAYLGASFGDVPFLLRYLADGNRPEDFVPGAVMDEQVRDLAEDARRARWLHSGRHEDSLTIPEVEGAAPDGGE